MNPALARWADQKERRIDDIVGIVDSHSSSRRHARNSPANNRLPVIIAAIEFPDDLSTIDGDTIANAVHSIEGPPVTPQKLKDDEEVTLPETPEKIDSSATSLPSLDDERRRVWWRCRVITAAGCMGFILLGAIAIMAFTLYQLRNEDDVSNGESPATNSSWLDSLAFDEQHLQGNAPSLFPTDYPSEEASEVGQDISTSLDLVRTIILWTASDFYTNPDRLSMDPASVHYKVMSWLMEDPSFASYSSPKVLQRFALGVTYWSLAPGATNDTQVSWMDYNDECNWLQNQSFPNPCDQEGSIVAVNLEGIGFEGTLAPEIGLLSRLETLVLISNNITGVLPTEIGLLTRLQQLNLHDNQITGTIPTEIGNLKDLDTVSLGFNDLEGWVPSEIGTLQGLKLLDLQANRFTGQLPEELWAAAELEDVELKFNQFSGQFSPEIGNLVNLRRLSLEGNDLTGSVPDEVCAISEFLIVSIDCEEVVCGCCATCDNLLGLPANESATIAPTSNATTMTTTTAAPTLCQEIKTEKRCYTVSEAIDFQIFNCDPSEKDFVAFFRTKDLADQGSNAALFWVPSCMSNDCHFMISEGTLVSGNVSVTDKPLIDWPLAVDSYTFMLFNIRQPNSLVALARSSPILVASLCN